MLTDNVRQTVSIAEKKMQDAVNFFEEDLKTYRVGKANPTVFNPVQVDYYGTMSPLQNVASVAVADARTLTVTPWEKSMIAKIEKAILDANIGLTPSNNGEMIRCVVPPLTEERRKELIKKAKAEGENTKVSVRNARRDAVEALKKLQKNEGVSEDIEKEGEDEVQKLTDRFVKKIDELETAKEKEIMTV